MKTTIVSDPLLDCKVKLVYGSPIEAAMVYQSTATPDNEVVERISRRSFGDYSHIIRNGKNDPDLAPYMIWVNSNSSCPLLGLVYGVTCYNNLISLRRISDKISVNGKFYYSPSISKNMSLVYKGRFFSDLLLRVEEENIFEIPKIKTKQVSFTDVDSFGIIEKSIIQSESTEFDYDSSLRKVTIWIKESLTDREKWIDLYGTLVEIITDRYDTNKINALNVSGGRLESEIIFGEFLKYYDHILFNKI